jgi:hypothetical protein
MNSISKVLIEQQQLQQLQQQQIEKEFASADSVCQLQSHVIDELSNEIFLKTFQKEKQNNYF